MSLKLVIENVAITSANIEYSFAIPNGVRKITIKPRLSGSLMKIAYTAGQIAAGNYMSFIGSKSIDGGVLKNQTIFFTSDTALDVAEIEIFKK